VSEQSANGENGYKRKLANAKHGNGSRFVLFPRGKRRLMVVAPNTKAQTIRYSGRASYNRALEETVAMICAKTCFLAEGVTTDRDTGQVSAFRLIQNLRAAAYPVSVPKVAFFCLWERDGADPSRSLAEFAITLDGRDLTRQPVDIDFGQQLMNCCTIWIADLEIGRARARGLPGGDCGTWSSRVVAGCGHRRRRIAACPRYVAASLRFRSRPDQRRQRLASSGGHRMKPKGRIGIEQ
jgi:hypothetical protein